MNATLKTGRLLVNNKSAESPLCNGGLCEMIKKLCKNDHCMRYDCVNKQLNCVKRNKNYVRHTKLINVESEFYHCSCFKRGK